MHDDGVDGILDLVADAGSQPADGGHAPRKLELRLDRFSRFQIVQRDQRAQSLVRVLVVDELK